MAKEVEQNDAAQTTESATKTKMTIAKSSKENHLVFTEVSFKDGLQTSLKRGILQVDTDEFDIDDVLAKAEKAEWKLKGPKDANGFYAVERVEE